MEVQFLLAYYALELEANETGIVFIETLQYEIEEGALSSQQHLG